MGGQAGFAYRPGARLSPHAAAALNYLDLGFQVNALAFDYLDRTLLLTRGLTVAGSAGARYRLTSRMDASMDVFYTPLRVRRSAGAAVQHDGLLNVRLLFIYRLRQ